MWLVLQACIAEQPVCEPTMAPGESLVTARLSPLRQFALALASRTGSSPFVLVAVEWATADVRAIVPYAVVVALLPAPDELGCAFVSSEGGLFRVRDVVADTPEAASAPGERVVAESVAFSPDSVWIVYQNDVGALLASPGGVLLSPSASGLVVSPNSSAVVFANASGLFATSFGGGGVVLLLSGAVGSSFAVSSDSSLVAAWQAGQVRTVTIGGAAVLAVAGDGVVGWSEEGSVSLYHRSGGQLWGISGDNSYSISGTVQARNISVTGSWCVFVNGADSTLWASPVEKGAGAPLSLSGSQSVRQFVVADSAVAFVTSGSVLWRVELGAQPAVVAGGVASVAAFDGVSVTFVNVNGTAWVARNASSVLLVSGPSQVVSGVVVQPNRVSAAYVSGGRAHVACQVPSIVVADGEMFGSLYAPGHLFLGNASRLANGTMAEGSVVLSETAVAVIPHCPDSSDSAAEEVVLATATLIVGTFARVAGCSECVQVGDMRYSSTEAVVAVSPRNCAPFSWAIFGIVLGVAAFFVAAVLLFLFLWKKRARKQAEANLERRELKYRAIGRLIPMK